MHGPIKLSLAAMKKSTVRDQDRPSCSHEEHQSEAEAGAVERRTGKKSFCPMCAGVESDQPGSCPKCGMALERNPTFREPGKAIYTCPMHPEIERDGPGSCPICGMALEPKTISAVTAEN